VVNPGRANEDALAAYRSAFNAGAGDRSRAAEGQWRTYVCILEPSRSSEADKREHASIRVYRMGYHSRATAHGFRATASTILNEQGFRPDVIERQLAHVERNKVRAAYHRAEYLPERRAMMQHWADFLDELSQRPTG